MALDRSQFKVPVLPKKVIAFPPLGGEVIVRGLLLSEQLANTTRQTAEREPQPGETEGEAVSRANGVMALRLLSQIVIDPEGKPLLSVQEWEALSATHPAEVFEFARTAADFAIGGADAEKN
ncbi:hypothetical protein ABL850_14750 [Variovorax paradoxus]|uniref:hypothetical protein n=1 Tax=Variovorax paradoxus TaxID=34073 RepID=UPI000402AF3A